MTTPTTGVWTYRETVWMQGDLTGYKVEAQDGEHRQDRRGEQRGRRGLHRRRHRPVDPRQEGHAPGRRRARVDPTRDGLRRQDEGRDQELARVRRGSLQRPGYRDKLGTYYGDR